MSIKPDHWIRRMALEQGMIEPFETEQVRGAVISYGVSSYGYDIRLAGEFKVPVKGEGVLDPKKVSAESFNDIRAQALDLPPRATYWAARWSIFAFRYRS